MSRAVERRSLQQQSASSSLRNAKNSDVSNIAAWRNPSIEFLAKCSCTADWSSAQLFEECWYLFPRARCEAGLKRSIYTFVESMRAQHHSCGPSWLRWESGIAVALSSAKRWAESTGVICMERMRTTFQWLVATFLNCDSRKPVCLPVLWCYGICRRRLWLLPFLVAGDKLRVFLVFMFIRWAKPHFRWICIPLFGIIEQCANNDWVTSRRR